MFEKSIMKPFIYVLLSLFITATSAFAEPLVTGLSGDLNSGDIVKITGKNFGSHGLKIEWLGGSDGNIESGSIGAVFSKKGWSVVDNSTNRPPVYDDLRKHSGSKSILCDADNALVATYNSQLHYDLGYGLNPGDSVFVSWWVNFQPTREDGQWKMFRINHNDGYSDTSPEIAIFNWKPGKDGMKQILQRPGGGLDKTYWCDINDMPGKNKWQRMSLFIVASSPGKYDGYIEYWISDPESGEQVIDVQGSNSSGSWPNLMNYAAGTTKRLRYLVWQNYFGNGLDGRAWLDDIYVQKDTQARVELGDKPTWQSCTHREIQMPSSWSNTSITVKVNPGSFSRGKSAYVYVIDSNGNVNAQGYPVTIGGSGGGVPPVAIPEPPTGLKVINN
jgi:hypothetical protein